jgi:FkbM family methyltransferase
MIIYNGISEDKKSIFYYTISETPIHIEIKVYEGYTNSFMFSNEIEVQNGVGYYTYIPNTWKDRKVLIYDKNTKKLIAPFVIDGDISLEDSDKFGYLKKLMKIEINELRQSGINDVIREHLYDRFYEDIVDVDEGDVVVDIGFNYGIFSLGALYKGASKIYGFEPNKHIYDIVSEIYPEKEKVKIYQYAVADKNEKTTFRETYDTLSSTISLDVVDYYKSYDVISINFFDFIVDNKIEKIDFLKVDCEGAEYAIFETIPDEYFSKIKKIHVEFHDNKNKEVIKIIEKLERNGFEYQFSEGSSELSNVSLIFAKNKNTLKDN